MMGAGLIGGVETFPAWASGAVGWVDLSGAEIELVSFERREHRLQFGRQPVGLLLLIDCPPSLNLLTSRPWWRPMR
jgi:hypothetical protein